MKLRKLLEKAEALLVPKERKRKAQKKNLKHVLKKLRQQEKSLLKRLETEPSKSKSAKIKEQAALAHAQRQKGLQALQSLQQPSPD